MLGIFDRVVKQLSVSRKLLLIYLLDLTAVIFLTTVLIEEKFIAIDFARKEVQGNTYIAVVRGAMVAMAYRYHHIGQADLPQMARAVDDAEHTFGEGMQSHKDAAALTEAIYQLSRNTDINTGHQAFEMARRLIRRIGDQSNLILDPDLDSYYTMSLTILRFPDLLSQLIHFDHLDIGKKTRLASLIEDISNDYQAAYAGSTDVRLRTQLEPTEIGLLSQLRALIQSETDATIANPLRDTALQRLAASWDATSMAMRELLTVREQRLFHRMWLHLGMAAVLLVIILSLVIFVSRQISHPLRQLARVAGHVQETHDYNLRAEWHSKDEIGHLVTCFNVMLEQLDRERLIQQELTATARAAQAQRVLVEAIPIPLIVTTIPDHRILHANASALAWVDPSKNDPWGIALEQKTRARFFQRIADQNFAHQFEALWHGTQRVSWVLLSASLLEYQGQQALITTFTPITRLKHLETRLRIWASVFEATSEGILVMDKDHKILQANAAFIRSTGHPIDELMGHDLRFLRDDRHDPECHQKMQKAVVDKGTWQGEYWLRKKKGSASPQWLVINTVRDEEGGPTHTIAIFVDITERKTQEEAIRHLAHHDALTGLPNRLLFDERLRMSLQQAQRSKHRIALIFIDLDRFKHINDSLGHHVGDGLLQSVAQRLTDSVRSGDTVCRQGGDEFVVVLNQVDDAHEITQIIEHRLFFNVLQPHYIEDVTLHISCSVGIAIYPDDGSDSETLMRNADTAMYAAKAQGRNNFQFFSAAMNDEAVERLKVETALRKALEEHQFELYVQPIIDTVSEALMSVEALIRWRHPDLGLIPPVKFIPIAEETGLIHEIGQWVLEEACRFFIQWQQEGLPLPNIAVNVSAIQFRHEGFLKEVATVLKKYGLPPTCLQLELTESLMFDNTDKVLADLQDLKDLGVGLSLDDFGTGYSSLSYLHRFPLNKIKIDRCFVTNMIENPADRKIIQAIIGLGKSLGVTVVAEGVEYEEERDLLRQFGCDQIQGYLIAQPFPIHALPTWVNENMS